MKYPPIGYLWLGIGSSHAVVGLFRRLYNVFVEKMQFMWLILSVETMLKLLMPGGECRRAFEGINSKLL